MLHFPPASGGEYRLALETSAERFQADTRWRVLKIVASIYAALLPPEALWLRVDELFSRLKRWPRLQLKTDHLPEKPLIPPISGFQKLPDLAIRGAAESAAGRAA